MNNLSSPTHHYKTFEIFTLTKGGPPRNIVPILSTITVLSAMVGTYAPPAVQEPHTTQI